MNILLTHSNGKFTLTVDCINPYAAGGYFGQYKMMQKKTCKIIETWASGYSSESTQWKLSNEY